jgi:cytochrome b561
LLRNNETRYGGVSIFFHWVIGLIFIGQIGLGWLMLKDIDPALQFSLFQWHKSFGFLILGLSALRLLWTLANKRPQAIAGMKAWERLAASGAHVLLYAALFAVPLAGWAIASVSPLQIPSFMFNLVVIPHLPMEVSEEAETLWANVHAFLAYSAALVAAAHIGAALRHHFFLRDRVLMRMLGR